MFVSRTYLHLLHAYLYTYINLNLHVYTLKIKVKFRKMFPLSIEFLNN